MGAKILVFLLVVALVFVTFKFVREREARLRERARKAPHDAPEGRDAVDGNGNREGGPKTVTLKKDPRTGVYEPADDD